jgi:hypothetical protein
MPRGWRRVWSDERDATLRRLYVEQGLEPRQIGKRMQLSALTVARRAAKLKLRDEIGEAEVRARRIARLALAVESRMAKRARAGTHWCEARTSRLELLYMRQHLSVGEIALDLGLSRDVVKRKVKRLGLAARRKAMGLRMARASKFTPQPVVQQVAMGVSRPEAFRWTKDPKAAAAKSARSRELRLTMAQVEAREVRRLEASAKVLALAGPEQGQGVAA